MKNFKPIISFIIIINTNSVFSETQRSVGFLVNKSSSIYLDTDIDAIVAPSLSYDSETFFIKQRSVGYHFNNHLDASIAYKDSFFEPDISNNTDMQQLDRRKGGLYAKSNLQYSLFSASIEQDILGRHNGYTVQAGIKLPLYLVLNTPFIIQGNLDYFYMDEKMSNYLYSVSSTESIRTSGRIKNYSIKNSTAIKYSLQAILALSNNFNITSILSHIRYDDKIKSSPIIEKNYNSSATIIVSYIF